MGVLGVDTVVVEGWSSCLLVGFVLVVGRGVNFGECVTSPVLFFGYLCWWYWVFGVKVEPPFQHSSLSFSSSSAVKTRQ